ncbi:hypothetical protein BDR07DRAFT_1297429 [Suillus spraguei]|nr:hypothetical protein BDR07DRAFT_1297429 [Suillus spraguei]
MAGAPCREFEGVVLTKFHNIQQQLEEAGSSGPHGSADGFNTEFPERLHIDFTKNAYRVTNQKDYVAQMTRWLAHQEAVDQFDAYLDWMLKRGLDDEQIKADDDGGDVEIEEQGEKQQPNQDSTDSIPATHILATQPSFHALTIASITQTFGGLSFLPAVSQYLQTLSIHPHTMSQAVYMGKTMDRICASPPSSPSGHSQGLPGQFDTVFVQMEDVNVHTQGTFLFDLPPHLCIAGQPFHLALVEWFKPFHAYDALLKMHTVSRSYAGQVPRIEVISITRIVGSCHLIPKFGTHVDPTWRADGVLDVYHTFYVNPWIDIAKFYKFRSH